MLLKNGVIWVGTIVFTLLMADPASYAGAYIPVGTAKTKKTTIAFPTIRDSQSSSPSITKVLLETVKNDLTFMDSFHFLKEAAFFEKSSQAGITPGSFQFSDWKPTGADFLIKSSLSKDPADPSALTFEVHVYNVNDGKEILAKRYMGKSDQIKTMAHTFANDVVETLTGLPGLFLTKIAMSCDRTGKKEIYVMNFDGSEVKQVTQHQSVAFAPAWSPDNTRIAYSVFTRHQNNIKNIDLFEFNLATHSLRILSNKKGINSGAAYSPDGKYLALTLSYLGNPEIFLMDLETRKTTQITHSLGFDVDPSWSADGKNLAFVSSRTGASMVFSTSVDGSKVQRLTYAGRYNATPTWSLQNNKIAFSGWLDRVFDIFIMNPDGSHIERLTKDQGSNEDPYFSPDGNFIAFSSNRAGQKNIYVMNVDGTFVKRLTYGLGNCVSPKWSFANKPSALTP